MEENIKESRCEALLLEDKILYLEGKIEILERNANARKAEHAAEYRHLLEEKASFFSRLEEMKKEMYILREEVRAKDAELLGHKRIRSFLPTFSLEDSSKAMNRESLSMDNCGTLENRIDRKEIASLDKSIDINRESALDRERSREKEQQRVEWILSHLKGTISLDLHALSPDKLKVFGRFFKKEFDLIYSAEAVLKSLEYSGKGTRYLVKSILYLSDRKEVISYLLPYLFKKHIVSDGTVYIKDIVKILYKTGTEVLLSDADTVSDAKCFFERCKESLYLLWLFEDMCQKCPRSVACLISEEYLFYICRHYPDRALSIVDSLEMSGVGVSTKKARKVLYRSFAPEKAVPYRAEQARSFYFD